jgi:glycosyltransferase involved in cell wall biosynthesis
MKLLLFSNNYPNSRYPLRGIFNLHQARALARYCEVRAVAPVQWFPVRLGHGAGPVTPPKFEVLEGLPVWHPRYVLTPGFARAAYPLQMGAALVPFVARLRREYPFDAILATWAFPDVVVGAALARMLGVPLAAKVHGSDINVQANYSLRRRQIRWALRQARRVLAVSNALKERLLELGVPGDRVVVCHNGVDRERFFPRDRVQARRALGLEPERRHVVYVGHFQEAKALPVLVEALGWLRSRGAAGFTTHLVGGGPLEAEIRSRAAKLGLGEDRLRLHGHRPHSEIPLWMATADVVCLPSTREGCPNVLLEAWASGTPAVATTVGGIPEIARPENAVLVPPGDPAALGRALVRALERGWDRETIRATTQGFTWDAGARAIFESLEGAETEQRRRPEIVPEHC